MHTANIDKGSSPTNSGAAGDKPQLSAVETALERFIVDRIEQVVDAAFARRDEAEQRRRQEATDRLMKAWGADWLDTLNTESGQRLPQLDAMREAGIVLFGTNRTETAIALLWEALTPAERLMLCLLFGEGGDQATRLNILRNGILLDWRNRMRRKLCDHDLELLFSKIEPGSASESSEQSCDRGGMGFLQLSRGVQCGLKQILFGSVDHGRTLPESAPVVESSEKGND